MSQGVSLGAQPSLKEMEAGPLPPKAISFPNRILGTGASQGTGFEVSPPPSGERWGRAEGQRFGWKTQSSQAQKPSPSCVLK